MTISHLLIIVVPSFLAGLLWARSLLSGAIWGVAVEVMGLAIVALPIPAGSPRASLTVAMVAASIALGAVAGVLGFAVRLLRK
jgi:hypothetical protein